MGFCAELSWATQRDLRSIWPALIADLLTDCKSEGTNGRDEREGFERRIEGQALKKRTARHLWYPGAVLQSLSGSARGGNLM